MAKKIKNMNKAELIEYAKLIGVENVDRHMKRDDLIDLVTKPIKADIKDVVKSVKRKLLGPPVVFCGACGRHVSIKEAKLCPDCKIYHCAMDAVSGTCIKCGLEFDINLRKKKDDNKGKKQTD